MPAAKPAIAARDLVLGDPRDPATQIGPVIDTEAKDRLDRWIADMDTRGATVARVEALLPHGNVYVNRDMINVVVGSQPFGGGGLSGSGPKAGGPNYLHRLPCSRW